MKNYVWEQACLVGEGGGAALPAAARPKSGSSAAPRGQGAEREPNGARHWGIPIPPVPWAGLCAGSVLTRLRALI